MRYIHGNIWDFNNICIPTNGVVKSNGENVMGAGVAKQAAERFPFLTSLLGYQIKHYGNVTFKIGEFPINKNSYFFTDSDSSQYKYLNITLWNFPTKNNWAESSSLRLIEESAKRLSLLMSNDNSDIYLPQPGIGLGGLLWKDVKPVLEKYFVDDRFVVVIYDKIV